MSKDEYINRLRGNRSSIAYRAAVKAIKSPGSRIRRGKGLGHGRFSALATWQKDTFTMLLDAGVSVSFGNDAPLGSKMGDYVIAHL